MGHGSRTESSAPGMGQHAAESNGIAAGAGTKSTGKGGKGGGRDLVGGGGECVVDEDALARDRVDYQHLRARSAATA
eukprot:2275689-Rhodomonas_salina.1